MAYQPPPHASASAAASAPPTPNPLGHAPPPGQIVLTTALLQSFRPSKIFSDHVGKQKSITSISFDDRSELFVTSSDDETLQLWSTHKGTHLRTVPSKKYGVHLARFTHKHNNVIYASTKEDNTLRYMSLTENKFLQYFKGHTGKVTSLQMSPLDDTFISAAVNDSVRLWDLRSPHCQGFLKVEGHPVAAFDPTGQVFAITINERSTILLYDVKNLQAEPFLVIPINDLHYLMMLSMPPRVPIITSLSFSPNGKLILVGTAGDHHYVLHSFDGDILFRLQGHLGLEREPAAEDGGVGMVAEAGLSGAECCWTPDGRFIISGTNTGRILSWEIPPEATWAPALENGAQRPIQALDACAVLDGHQGGVARAVAFAPKSAMLVSAGKVVTLWLPERDKEGEEAAA